MEPQQQKVVIVGSGLAGLLSANLLFHDPRQRYSVKVLESGTSLSLDAASVSVPESTQTSSDRIDLPMRAFAGGYYSNLKALYDHLGIAYQSQPFLFEFATTKGSSSTCSSQRDGAYFVHASNLHQLVPRPNGTGMMQYVVQVIYLIVCYAWFSICCFLVTPGQGETLQHYLDRIWMPHHFVTYYLAPLISSVTTCPHKSLLAFPASDITEYKRRTHGAPHYRVSGGVKGVQDRLVRGIPHELGAVVTAVETLEKGVKVSWTKGTGSELETYSEYFDRAILAIAPHAVGQIFEPLRHHMSQIPTALVESVVHTDRSVLVKQDRRAPNAHNAQLICLKTLMDDAGRTESHHIQPCGRVVTTCPHSPIDPALVFHSAKFPRVLRSLRSQRIVNAIFEIDQKDFADEKSVPQWRNGQGNVWLVGGWCWDGMVLLEGCVVSAMRVADEFGVEVPWRHQQSRV